MERYRDELRRGLINVALKWGEGYDRSGKPYAWMVDTRELLLQGPYLHYAARLLWERLKPHRPEVVAGMTLAANPLVIALMYESRQDGQPVDGAIIRRAPKEDGLRKLVEGPLIRPGARVAILDDLVNAGHTQRQAMQAIAPFDCRVVAVGVLIDYLKEGALWLRELEIPLEALFTLPELGVTLEAELPSDAARLAWTFEGLNSGRYNAPKSTPAVTPEALYVGSDQGFLVALSHQGQELWRYSVRDQERGVHSSPLYVDGRVYFGAYDGYLYCVQEGRLVWETRPGQWIGSSPTHHDDLIYVGIEYGEAGGSLLAVEAATGRQRWELKAGHYIHSSPLVDEPRGQVLVGANDGLVRAADLASGRLRWEFETGGPIKGQPVVDPDGTVFVASFDGQLYALSAGTGQELWRRRLSFQLYNTPLVYESLVIAGGSSGRLLALDRATGEVRWVAPTGASMVGGAALVGRDLLAAAGTDGQVFLYAASTGRPLWSHSTGVQVMGTPAATQGGFYLATFNALCRFSL